MLTEADGLLEGFLDVCQTSDGYPRDIYSPCHARNLGPGKRPRQHERRHHYARPVSYQISEGCLRDIQWISTYSGVVRQGKNTTVGILQVTVKGAAVRKELWLIDLEGRHLDNRQISGRRLSTPHLHHRCHIPCFDASNAGTGGNGLKIAKSKSL